MTQLFIEVFLKFFFLTTPFFAVSMFIALTPDVTSQERAGIANRVAFASWIIVILLFFCGQWIFRIFGISVDAFRIGAGALLFLSAVSLMNPKVAPGSYKQGADIAVVPLAMPVVIGPATCGPLLVMGNDYAEWRLKVVVMCALTAALVALWLILRMATWMERHFGPQGLSILMRLTGLILSALSAQMIMTGVVSFLKG